MSGFTRSTDLSTEELHRHADQLILAGLQRTKEATALTRTESNASTSSQSRPDHQHQHHTHSNSSSSSHLQHSASTPAVGGVPLAPTPSRTSWFGFGYASKEEKRAAKEEKRGRKSRPTSETFTSPVSGISSRPTSASGRPSTATGVTSNSNTPLGPASPQVAPLQVKIGGSNNGNLAPGGGASLPSAPPIMTIREGVPLTHSLTVDSVMTTASEADGGRRGRQRARSSSPFRAFRSSRSRGGTTAKEDKKREKSSGRSPSPAIHALKRSESDAESDAESLGFGMRRKKKGVKVRRTAFDQRSNNGGETEDEGGVSDEEEEEWSEDEDDIEDDDDGFDPETTQNTEANATPMDPEVCLSIEGHHFPGYDDDIELPDPLGEGVNVVRPEAPMFAQTLMAHNRPSVTTTSPARARAASPRSVNTGGSGGDDADSSGRRRSSSVDGQTIGAVASSPTSSSMSPTTTSAAHPALTPAQVAARTPKKKKTIKSIHSTLLDPLPLNVSRPHFTRDRCTVVLKHGNARERSSSNATAHPVIPEGSVVDELGNVDGPRGLGGGYQREPKRYVVFSDMSEESKWAVEWGIGTVLRDGDEMILVTVQETESKLDPAEGATVDRLQKLRNQQERQALASLLVRQATSLLQRTKLNVTVTCQAMHAKNARRLFLDIIDLLEPTMVIVGSRGLGKLKGIILGSTSHYLIQKSSVPVMVARRRLKRPTRKSHTAAQAIAIRSEKRVSLADARIEKMSSGQGKGATGVDVEDIQREHEQAEKEWPRIPGEDEEVVVEEEEEEEEDGATGSGAQEQETPQSPSTSSRADSPSAEKRAPGVSGKVAGV